MNLFKRILFSILYIKKPVWDTGVSPPELLEFIHQHPPGRALDLGCGTGTNALTLARNGWQTTGVDFVSKAIRQARKKSLREGIEVDFFVDDVSQLKKIDAKFDLILDIGCFHSLSKQEKVNYIRNLDRLLSPTGSFMIYAWLADSEENSTGLTETDLDSFSKALSLTLRQDGKERGRRASVWLTYAAKKADNG